MEKIPTIEKSRKEELKTEFGSLRKDWIENKGINLNLLKYSELKGHIREFYNENRNLINEVLETKEETLEYNLETIPSKKMDYERVNKIRQSLDLPKWVSLSETVSFIKTALDYDDTSIKEKYMDYCSNGLSLDEMRNILAYDNDVKPTRLDTDIYHQSPQRSRAAVEIVSNAIDAMQPANKSIGRFGVGFYQILSHLNNEEDRVKIETGNDETGFYTIEFRLKNKEIEFSLGGIENAKEKGTKVSLITNNFPAEEAEKLVKKHFSYNNVAKVLCNGEKVNNIEINKNDNNVEVEINSNGFSVIDKGIGMSPKVILEKLLVPKISGKQPIGELMKEQNIEPEYFVERFLEGEKKEGKVVINVGGVMIEEIPIKGTRTVKTLVLEMPSFTLLGEERNAIAVDEVTVEASKKLIDRITSEGDISIINSLVPAIKKLQERSRLYEKKDNLISYFQEKTQDLLRGSKEYFLPNTREFERLNLPNINLIDPILKQSAWKTINGMEMPNLEGSGDALYVAPLNYRGEFDPIVITGKNRVVLDRDIYESLKTDPTLINLYLKNFSKGKSIEIRKIMNFDPSKVQEKTGQVEDLREYKDMEDYISREWKQLGAPDLFSIQKITGQLDSFTYRKYVSDIQNKIINNFPPSLVKKFVHNFIIDNRSFHENGISDISSLAQNPELLNILAELDICPFQQPSYDTRKVTRLEKFPGIKNDYNDKIEKVSSEGFGWYCIPYYGEKVLVSGDGRMFRGDFKVNKDGKRIAFYDDVNKRLKFIDAATKEFEKNEIIFEDFSNAWGNRDIVFTDLFGEECVGLTKIRSEIPEHRFNNNDTRRRNEMLFFRVSDGKRILENIGKGRIITGNYSWGKDFIDCERSNPSYHNEYNPWNDRKGPYSTITGIINPKTGKVSEKREEWDEIIRKFRLEQNPPQYIHEITPRIKIVFDRDTQLMNLFIDDQLKKRIHTEIQDDPKETFNNIYHRNVKINTFGEKGNEGLLINNKRSENHNYIYQKDRWSEKEERTKKVKWLEDKIINNEGVIVYAGKRDEAIIQITGFDGKEYFIISKYPVFELQDGKKNIKISSTDKHFIPLFVLDTEGNKLSGDMLKNIPPFEFRLDVGENGTFAQTSFFEPETWTINPSLEGIKLLDRKTGKNIIDKSFTEVIYHSDTNLWECLLTPEHYKYSSGDGFQTQEALFVDAKGIIVDQGTIKEFDTPYYNDKIEETNFLSKEKTILLQKVIEGYEDQEVERIKLLIERTFKYGDMSDNAYRIFAPILVRLNYLNESLIDNELIEAIEKRIGNYDINNQVFFYEFLSRSIPDQTKNILKEQEVFLEKFIKIFNEKIAVLPVVEKEEIFENMTKLRNYRDQYLTTGWNIIQHKTPVPTELIPEKIRPIIEYLRTDEKESMSYKEKPKIIMESKNSQFTLSQLIQTKRLNETEISQFSGSIEKLIETVHIKTKGKHQEHIQREIIHPIYYQSVNNPYLFIRELVQNAHDALIESKGEINNSVFIDLISRSEESLTVRIEDPVGMTKKILLNYFLVPGETTKKDKKEQIGYFGQGLFTLFRGSKEVLVKTGVGDGMVTKMKITPNYNEDGTLADLDITMEEEKSNYKGTIIEKTMDTKYPQVEAAYIKNATCSFTSLVDGNIININLNDTQINQPQTILSQVSIPNLGSMKIYEAPNNVVTQRGLFVKSIDEDYDSGMNDVETLLHKRGYVLQIPENIDLTRSRNEIAQKEKVLPAMKEQIPLLKIGAYIEFFRKDIERGSVIQLDNLPYDFFYEIGRGSGIAFEDAKRIRNGLTIKDVSPYKDHGMLINLLIHLPVAELDEKTWSMYELRDASLENKEPLNTEENFQKLPKMLQKYLREGKSAYDSNERAHQNAVEKGEIVEDFSLKDLEKQPNFIKELITKNKENYDRFNELAQSWLKYLDGVFFSESSNTENTFFHTTENVSAHASSFLGIVGWNLSAWKGWKVNRFEEKDLKDNEIQEFLDVLSHEYTHIIEKTGGMTHNKDFYLKQSEVLAKMISKKLEAK